METVLYSFIGSAVAYSFWIWCGSPNSQNGEYSTDMILSFLGRWLLTRWFKKQQTIYKLFLCPYCLAVWITFLVAITNTTVLCSIISAACTAPFVSLFMLINKNI